MPPESSSGPNSPDPRNRILLAFAAVYLIWGSTYLASKFAVQTIPPYLMGGSRFLIPGTILYLWALSRGSPAPTRREWGSAAIVGALLLCGGNGAVNWAEQRVPSGLAALLVASVPLWMVILDWARPGGRRPTAVVAIGLLVGLIGVGVLALPGIAQRSGPIDRSGSIMLVIGSISWAAGSIYSRHGPLPASAEMSTGIQMIAGSVALFIVGAVSGEFGRLHLAAVTPLSLLGWSYLVLFGSLLGFTAYIYLLRETTAARASTYAYVNPVVAVFLGWAVAGEAISTRTIVAAAIILAGVVMITAAGQSRRGVREH
jgi:drug/metabolite transporter (DMT)-like permease